VKVTEDEGRLFLTKNLDSRLDTLLVGGSDGSGDNGRRSSLVLTVTEVWIVSCLSQILLVMSDILDRGLEEDISTSAILSYLSEFQYSSVPVFQCAAM
jgi:hypothetical protein